MHYACHNQDKRKLIYWSHSHEMWHASLHSIVARGATTLVARITLLQCIQSKLRQFDQVWFIFCWRSSIPANFHEGDFSFLALQWYVQLLPHNFHWIVLYCCLVRLISVTNIHQGYFVVSGATTQSRVWASANGATMIFGCIGIMCNQWNC